MNKDQISKIQQAVWKLQDAQLLLASVCFDHMTIELRNMVDRLQITLDRGPNE